MENRWSSAAVRMPPKTHPNRWSSESYHPVLSRHLKVPYNPEPSKRERDFYKIKNPSPRSHIPTSPYLKYGGANNYFLKNIAAFIILTIVIVVASYFFGGYLTHSLNISSILTILLILCAPAFSSFISVITLKIHDFNDYNNTVIGYSLILSLIISLLSFFINPFNVHPI
jgi:hypothetical protein